MNNPSDQNFGLAGPVSTPDPTTPVAGDGNLQQLATNQNSYINQFMSSPPADPGTNSYQQMQPSSVPTNAPNTVTSNDVSTVTPASFTPSDSRPVASSFGDETVNSTPGSNDFSTPPGFNPEPIPVSSPDTVNLNQGSSLTDPNPSMSGGMVTPVDPTASVGMPSTSDTVNTLPPLPYNTGNFQPITSPPMNNVGMGATTYSQPAADQFSPVMQNASGMQSPPMQVNPPDTTQTVYPTPVNYMPDPVAMQNPAQVQPVQPVDLVQTPPSDGNFSQPPVIVAQPPSANQDEDRPLIGTHQVAVNEQYAENFNPNFRLTQNQQTLAAKPVEPKGIDFSKPSVVASVNQSFSDASSISNDNFTSTGFLPAFDDSNNSMLPVVSDDDDMFAEDDFGSDVVPAPYGFSDFDPNEQMMAQSDLGGFESQSLEEVAENIDVDFSEKHPGHFSQSLGSQGAGVSVLTQDPVQDENTHINHFSQPHQVINDTMPIEPAAPTQTQSPPQYIQSQYTQLQPQIEPMVTQSTTYSQTTAELSPAARLNQLLEAEEAAEKVIIEKQNQVLKKPAKPQTMQMEKESIFKQLDPDVSLQGDIRSGMSVRKPSSRYFLIVSLVIIISFIGFLLVLLGLTLL